MDHGLPGSSFHWIHQARILEWAVISISRGSSRCRDRTQVSSIAGRFFTVWTTREAILTQGEHINSATNLFYIQCKKTRILSPMWGDGEGSDVLNQVLSLFNSNTAPFIGLWCLSAEKWGRVQDSLLSAAPWTYVLSQRGKLEHIMAQLLSLHLLYPILPGDKKFSYFSFLDVRKFLYLLCLTGNPHCPPYYGVLKLEYPWENLDPWENELYICERV